ncbi:transposable element Tc3 transposase [Trichonephila clavipes]|nr:transposable element Tc3 transposase [Trichonephila clavipes]
MITNFFIPELNNHDVLELWFQQDGAACHTARATIDLLKDTFGDRLISRFGPVNWPPRSCDLTPLDYFLTKEVKRDFCDLPIRRNEGRVVNTPLVFNRVLFQERREKTGERGGKKGTEKGDLKREEKESGRERGARLVWRKGLSPEIGVKKTMNAGGVENRID